MRFVRADRILMSMLKPIIINQSELEWESWDDRTSLPKVRFVGNYLLQVNAVRAVDLSRV